MKQNVEEPNFTPTRRHFLGAATACFGGAAASTVVGSVAYAQGPDKPEVSSKLKRTMWTADDNAVVDTEYGKVRGYTHLGIFNFKGIPYGDDTGGSNRFLPPKPPKPWTDVRSSMTYGKSCPQVAREGWNHDEEAWLMRWGDGIPGEDCLSLNIWTPAVNDGKKRTVMFWLHGGGFSTGSSQELPSYDGEQLARRGDVVVVSINHRLNLLGFLNLQKYGDQFKHSGTVGMLDAVQALEWVKKNIANFGGNPDSVMIFGQSGGGGKVAYLMAMPSAKGLFHRAIIESGSQPWNNSTAISSAVAEAVLDELQLRPDQAGELQMMPYSKLSAAATAVMLRMAPPPPPNLLRRPGHAGWCPVTDGEIISETPFYPKAPTLSAHIPLMIGSTLNEFINATNHPEVEKMTEAELLSRVEASLPGKGVEAIAIYRKADPTATPYDLWSEMNATTGMRRNAVEIAKRQASQGASVYNYEFRWQTPVLNGRPRAFHCSEITFAFDNTDRCDSMTGGGEDARALGAKCSEAWLHFAKTGDPNHPGLPKWDPVASDRVPTMFLDNHCQLMINPDDNQLRITA